MSANQTIKTSHQQTLNILTQKQQKRNQEYSNLLAEGNHNTATLSSMYRYTPTTQEYSDRVKDLLANLQAQTMSLEQEQKEQNQGQISLNKEKEWLENNTYIKPAVLDLTQLRCKLEGVKIRKYKLQLQKNNLAYKQCRLRENYQQIKNDVKILEDKLKQKESRNQNQNIRKKPFQNLEQFLLFKHYITHNAEYSDSDVEEIKQKLDNTEHVSISSIKLSNILSYKVMESDRQLAFLRKRIQTDFSETGIQARSQDEDTPQKLQEDLSYLRQELAIKKQKEMQLANKSSNMFQESIDYHEIEEEVQRKVQRQMAKERKQIDGILGGIKKMLKMIGAVGSTECQLRAHDILKENQVQT